MLILIPPVVFCFFFLGVLSESTCCGDLFVFVQYIAVRVLFSATIWCILSFSVPIDIG